MKALKSKRNLSMLPKALNQPFYAAVLVAIMASTISLTADAYRIIDGKIYDEQGERVQLRGVNWFGFETNTHAPHGLWARSLDEMIEQMQSLGINAVRLPLSPPTLRGADPSGIDYGLNPELEGMNALELLDHVIERLDRAGIYILLDHHRPNTNAISPLWYTDEYSEAQWLADLEFMATRYRHVPHVIGIDLKNEPHGPATWGTGNLDTDWNLAAERAARVVLTANPNLIVFVAGIEEQEYCSSPHAHGWGGNLEPLRCMPLAIASDKLALAPHFYGPDVYMHDYFNAEDFPANMPAIWETNFGFATEMGYAVIPTEFGSRYGHGGLEKEVAWFDAAIDWLIEKDIRDSFFWSWNPNSSDTGGLLKDDWTNVWNDKLERLHALWGISDATTAPTPAPTPDPMPDTGDWNTAEALSVDRQLLSDWGSGYCVSYTIHNYSDRNVTWWHHIEFKDILTESWGAQITLDTQGIQAVGQDWNSQLAPGQSTEYGFCANRVRQDDPTSGVHMLPAEFQLLSDWGAGYCMQVVVTNTTNEVIPWETRFAVDGEVTQTWSAQWSVQAGEARVIGEDWNAHLPPGASTEFGFCAQR
ncbi:MAG TPA: endoglucanase [Halothiobacillus sp.]|nr:endoglucanase [Halothiobacillus sp.]